MKKKKVMCKVNLHILFICGKICYIFGGDYMEKYDVKFKKKFGQNFLKDINVVKKIVRSAEIDGKSLVIEVGPGGGIMTRELSLEADNVLAYEIDEELKEEHAKRLGARNNINILFQDFLESDIVNDVKKYDYDKIVEFLKISLGADGKAERQAKILLKQAEEI